MELVYAKNRRLRPRYKKTDFGGILRVKWDFKEILGILESCRKFVTVGLSAEKIGKEIMDLHLLLFRY